MLVCLAGIALATFFAVQVLLSMHIMSSLKKKNSLMTMTITPGVGLLGLGRVPSDHHCVNHGSANRTTSMAKLHHLQPGTDQQNARISKSKIIVTKQNQGRGAGATERVYQQQFYR